MLKTKEEVNKYIKQVVDLNGWEQPHRPRINIVTDMQIDNQGIFAIHDIEESKCKEESDRKALVRCKFRLPVGGNFILKAMQNLQDRFYNYNDIAHVYFITYNLPGLPEGEYVRENSDGSLDLRLYVRYDEF